MAVEDPTKFPVLGGKVLDLKRFALSDSKEWSCFNPSIGRTPDGRLAMAYRASNYVILQHGELFVTNGGKIRNQIWFSELSKDFTIENFRKIELPKYEHPTPRGAEDARIFWRDGHWNFTATMAERDIPVARLCVCEMDVKATKATSLTLHTGVRHNKPEKNWMVPDFTPNRNFDFVYGPTAIIKDGKVIHTLSDNPQISGLRGNSHLVEQEDGTYLAIMHKLWISTMDKMSELTRGPVKWVYKDYGHYLVRFDQFGTLVEMSDPFRFVSRGIEFAAGMVEIGGDLVISFGKWDQSSHIAIVLKKAALRMMKPVTL